MTTTHILDAPPDWIALEPPRALLELIDVALEHLHAFMAVGNGWLIIRLENLKSETEKRILDNNKKAE